MVGTPCIILARNQEINGSNQGKVFSKKQNYHEPKKL
jgi:hypothetical protein